MMCEYLDEMGFRRASAQLRIEAASLLAPFSRARDRKRTKNLRDVVEEYVEMKEAAARRERADGVIGRVLEVIDDELRRREASGARASTARARMSDSEDEDEEALEGRLNDARAERGMERAPERETLEDTPRRRRTEPEAQAAPSSNVAGGRRKRGSAPPRRIAPNVGQTSLPTPSGRQTVTPVALGTVPSSAGTNPPLGSLRPFHMPALPDQATERMANVIVNAFGGRGRFMASDYADPTPMIDEEQVDTVMRTLLEEDGDLGDFLESMISEVQNARGASRQTSPQPRARENVDATAPFGSPHRRTN